MKCGNSYKSHKHSKTIGFNIQIRILCHFYWNFSGTLPFLMLKKNKILNQNGIRLLSSLTFFKGIQKLNV
ncbi:hypothetical protein LEP1GSC037_3297 [Leptospira interrogans str. 2006001854]|uniref:Uncharacterized protein n=1 Tax=Leptospira interrogans str. 2006001854 TaxID=1001590 RepID=M6GJT2_LEPIR|nr:hypothetical protein LEP1GSC037_3297 [Leptospira interrogans str. 2006001854]